MTQNDSDSSLIDAQLVQTQASETLMLRQQRNECKTNAFEMSDAMTQTINLRASNQ